MSYISIQKCRLFITYVGMHLSKETKAHIKKNKIETCILRKFCNIINVSQTYEF